MRKFLSTIAAAGALTLAAAAATPAAAVDFINGHYSIDAHNPGEGAGLEVRTTRSFSGGNIPTFSLDLNETWGPESLFKIWTDETDVDWDDLGPQDIEVTFTFDSPILDNGTAGGVTGGYSLFGVLEGGYLNWDNDGVFEFTFGDTGVLQLTLSDADFNRGLFGVAEGKKYGDVVTGEFKLTGLPSAVPEPGTWALMITGFGLAGTALRRQRKLALAA